MDSSLIIALSALVLSILSPIASAWINGHYRMKEKEAELTHASEQAALELAHAREQEERLFYLQHRAEVIERYISTAGAAIKNPCPDTMAAFGSAQGEIYLYVDEYLWADLDKLDSMVKYHPDIVEGLSLLNSICKQLSFEEVRPKNKPEPERDNKK